MRNCLVRFVWLFALCLLPFGAWATEFCDDLEGRICVRVVQTDDGVSFFGRNAYPLMPVTLTLETETSGLTRTFGDDAPITLSPGAERRVMAYGFEGNGEWRYNFFFSWSPGDVRARHDDTAQYRLPFEDGASFPVMQGCNGRFSHIGIQKYAVDFQMPIGTPILAARAGTVVRVKEDSSKGGPDRSFVNDGNNVMIQHADRTIANYVHLRPNGAEVAEGDRVRAGDLIGYSGNTGFSTGPHLHFEVSRGAKGIVSETLPMRFEARGGEVSCPDRGSRPVAISLP